MFILCMFSFLLSFLFIVVIFGASQPHFALAVLHNSHILWWARLLAHSFVSGLEASECALAAVTVLCELPYANAQECCMRSERAWKSSSMTKWPLFATEHSPRVTLQIKSSFVFHSETVFWENRFRMDSVALSDVDCRVSNDRSTTCSPLLNQPTMWRWHFGVTQKTIASEYGSRKCQAPAKEIIMDIDKTALRTHSLSLSLCLV